MSDATIQIPVDLTNPGQFFACCGLLEIADRLWPGAEGWFDEGMFNVSAGKTLYDLMDAICSIKVGNAMTESDRAVATGLALAKKGRRLTTEEETEKKRLEALRRELPIVLSGSTSFRIDWFADDFAGGSRFKTWAGQQSVLDIAVNMHKAVSPNKSLWASQRKIGLPFNFDSDLGGQGSALDIGFSFDPLAGSELTRIEGTCRPALEFLAFVGLQRFRPLEVAGQNHFVYAAWPVPLAVSVASAVACDAVRMPRSVRYAFSLLYRTKYLKSFLPAAKTEGDRNE